MRTTIVKGLLGLAAFCCLFISSDIAQAASLTPAQIQAIVALLQAFGADPSVVVNVQATLTGMPVVSTGAGQCLNLYNNLFLDQTDSQTNGEVSKLQQFLGGRVTGYFGPATMQLVENWQAAHGVVSSGMPDTTGYGYVGPKTRATLACSSAPNAVISTNYPNH